MKNDVLNLGLQYFAEESKRTQYFSLHQSEEATSIYIYGDITSWEWLESDVSSYTLARAIEDIQSGTIEVYINSYGGEVAEGFAIHNALRRSKANVVTNCDGFACSAASLVFAAGDERKMWEASLIMIHGAQIGIYGDAKALRKQADDIETMTQVSISAYKRVIDKSEDEIEKLLNEETWITPKEALEMGFATEIIENKSHHKATHSARQSVVKLVMSGQKADPLAPKMGIGLDTAEELEDIVSRLEKKVLKMEQITTIIPDLKGKEEDVVLNKFQKMFSKGEKENEE